MTAARPPADDAPSDDPLLDACLDEVLGHWTPPDLTARIVRALEERRTPPTIPSRAVGRSRPPRGTARQWLTVAAAACFVLATALVASIVWKMQRETDRGSPAVVGSSPPHETPSALRPSPDRQHAIASDVRKPSTPSDAPSPDEGASPNGFDQTPPFAVAEESGAGSSAASLPSYARIKPRPASDAEVLAFVNGALRGGWRQAGVTPSPPATDGEWARRLYLRLLGRIPAYEELTAFLNDAASHKREQLVDRLLFDDDYAEAYARHWSDVWTNVLIGRSAGSAPDDLADRTGLEQYLRWSFQTNKPFDQMAFELISATGANRPGSEGYNGAVNFLLANQSPNQTLATSRTARVFLGKQLHCAQCHNHPFETWTQDDYWGLNAFFRQATVVRDADKVRLANRDFPGETGDMANAEIYYDRLNGLRKVAYPTFLDGARIPPHGAVAQVDRRRALANFVAESPDLSQALTNRLWAHFLGYGMVEPVDDLRPGNPPTHPELLAYLSEQVVAHGYDFKRLLRWIVLSDAFAVSSRISTKNAADAPERGERPLFSRYYTRQFDAEAMYDSLVLLAEGADRAGANVADRRADRRAWLDQFTLDLETDEGDEATTFNGTIPQALALMNGDLMRQALDARQGFLRHIAAGDLPPGERLERLFLATVARKPVKREIEAANRLVAERQGDVRAALQDLGWAVLNSNEFILDH